MKYGTGLQFFSHSAPERFFDVGMAEQHAVTFAAGLASQGMLPVVCIYSTFLQRSYDQILHDVNLLQENVVFAIDARVLFRQTEKRIRRLRPGFPEPGRYAALCTFQLCGVDLLAARAAEGRLQRPPCDPLSAGWGKCPSGAVWLQRAGL